ncbi:RNA methyltransferase [bacterium]|jgi:23S rRNA (guanosine2251-2'-O)-methyltransferase|nr:RNA methyltransferase [bacterium]
MAKDKKKQLDVIYGIHSICELLKAKRRKLVTLYTTKIPPKGWKSIQKIGIPKLTNLQYVSREFLAKFSGTTDHQGVVGLAQQFVFRKSFFDSKKSQFVLLLDGIQDPRNLGAILRSAYCTGVDGVIITKKHSAPITGAALKASAGLAEHLDIYQAPSSLSALQELGKQNYNVYLAALSSRANNAIEVTYKMPLCIVIGNEAQGISKSLFSFGTVVQLPQKTSDVSYNASVAAGILLFTIATYSSKI